ncbi:hypothetical protein G6F43_002984 [Rhizopus delemar]|nr:hypothetical protein G6F43_002984 [Rhizopus delemar]
MDLRNLLNQKEENTSLTLVELEKLLANGDNSKSIEKITNATFTFPSLKNDSFVFFNVFIQLLLSITHEEDPYDAHYTRSIIIDSLRTCINGLLRQFGMSWLLEFPQHFYLKTWISLHSSSDTSILIYLYGLVLALSKKPDISYTTAWVEGLVNFIQSDTHEIIAHLWLSICAIDDAKNQEDFKRLCLNALESRLEMQQQSDQERFKEAIRQMLMLLKNADAAHLAARVNQQLGNALTRPPFSKDEFKLGLIQLETFCQLKQGLLYPRLFNIFIKFKSTNEPQKVGKLPGKNPLLNYPLLLTSPSDDQFCAQRLVADCTCFWIRKMGAMIPDEFDMYMKNLIIQQYPTEQKTNLDTVLADWAVKDRFQRHRDLIIDTIISLLQKPRYNNRTAPFYAFVHLFNLHEERLEATKDNSYKIKSGALIDAVQFDTCTNQELVNGCLFILKRITEAETNYSGKLENWVEDCLRVTKSDVAQRYIEWLCKKGCDPVLRSNQKNTLYMRYLSVALRETVNLSFHTVPVLLRSFDDTMLNWLFTPANASTANKMLTQYFGDGAQVSKHILVRDLLVNKSKNFMDRLLTFLRSAMYDTSPSSTKSRKWFKNHFLGPMLIVAGDEDGWQKNVASRIFRQFFKTSNDFEWYFQTPLVEQLLPFDFLDISKSHDIYSVRNMGLASVLQEMAQLEDNDKKEKLVKMWFDLWTTSIEEGGAYKFTVPVSWVLQCSGLYDQAPVFVKQMIRQFIKIGMESSRKQEPGFLDMPPERSFVDRMMDLVLLSDTPEPDSLFDLFLSVACKESDTIQEQVIAAIINILIEISEELEVEMKLFSMSAEQQPVSNLQQVKISKKKIMKRKNVKKMRKVLMKQQAELEESLQKTLKSGDRSIKALTTLVQRLINFLLSLLNHTAADTSVIKQNIQYQLTHTPLFYEPLAKLSNLIRQPEDLQEDIQTTIETSLDYLKNQSKEKKMLEIAQKILQSSLVL